MDVTYQVRNGRAEGDLLAEGTIACFVGDAYPAVSEFGVLPSYTSSTYYVLTGLPEADETVPAGGVTKTLIYTNHFPFRVSSSPTCESRRHVCARRDSFLGALPSGCGKRKPRFCAEVLTFLRSFARD